MHDNYWRGWYDTNPQGVQTTKAVGAASFLNAMWVFARRSDGQIVYHSTPLYRLPFAGNGLWTVVNGNYDDPGDSHPENQYFGFDFAQYDQDAGLGADILAARAGTVVGLREDYNCNPCSPANSGNWIAIEHADGTVATYSHIKLNGVLVNVGDYVVQGQHIAEMGNTGNSGGPHVHFEIHEWWSAENVSGPSVPAYFCDGLHSVWRPRTSQALTPTACSL
ncbi:MAG: M23 family metallopeptidase [Polyangiaceae bacterium]|nr:M23 family metallopeptidase [Polyangiaceae bacterium]